MQTRQAPWADGYITLMWRRFEQAGGQHHMRRAMACAFMPTDRPAGTPAPPAVHRPQPAASKQYPGTDLQVHWQQRGVPVVGDEHKVGLACRGWGWGVYMVGGVRVVGGGWLVGVGGGGGHASGCCFGGLLWCAGSAHRQQMHVPVCLQRVAGPSLPRSPYGSPPPQGTTQGASSAAFVSRAQRNSTSCRLPP